jgi:hypothetical protein
MTITYRTHSEFDLLKYKLFVGSFLDQEEREQIFKNIGQYLSSFYIQNKIQKVRAENAK